MPGKACTSEKQRAEIERTRLKKMEEGRERRREGGSSALKKETDGCFAPEWSSVRIAACGEEKATDGRSAMGTEVRELREEVESLLYTRQQARHWRYKAD